MRTGNPRTARAPASSAEGLNAAQRDAPVAARSASMIGVPWRCASTQGPSPRVYWASSIAADTLSVLQSEACGRSSDRSITAAPLISVTWAPTSHSLRPPGPPPPRRRPRTRTRRSAGTAATPFAVCRFGPTPEGYRSHERVLTRRATRSTGTGSSAHTKAASRPPATQATTIPRRSLLRLDVTPPPLRPPVPLGPGYRPAKRGIFSSAHDGG